MNNLDLLVPRERDQGSHTWATVTQAAPLRVQLDGETNPLPFTPDTLVGGLAVDDRVWVQLATNNDAARRSRRVVIIGRAGGPGRVVGAIKTIDEMVNNGASPQSDDELSVAFEAGVNYILLAWLVWTGVDTTADFRQDFATIPGSTGTTVSSSFYAQPTSATASAGTLETGTILDSSAANSGDQTRGAIAGTLSGWLVGTFFGGDDGGTLVLRWAQGTAGATNLVLERGSSLMLIPIP